MFKIILLAVLVSVVWSTASATYILHDNSGFGILGDTKLSSFHEPLFQTHLNVDYGDDNHGIVLSQIPGHEIQFIPQSISSLPRIIEGSSGFKIPETRGGALKNTNVFFQSNQNEQLNHSPKITQQQVEVKIANDNYNTQQTNNHGTNPGSHTDSKIPYSGNLFQGLNIGNDYSGNYGQTDTAQKVSKNSQYISNVQTNIQDILQQKFINIGLDQNAEPKYGIKDNTEAYSKDEQGSTAEEKNNPNQKSNQQSTEDKNIRFDTNHNSPSYDLRSNEKVYPLVFSEGPLEQAEYIKLHGGNVQGYIPSTFGSTGNIYGELGITDGIRYHSDLNSNVAIRLDHNTPILISNNFHGNLNDHDGILIRLRDDDENLKTLLGDSIAYSNLENGTTDLKGNDSPNYPEENYAFNVQQKSVEVGIKSVTEQSSTYNNQGDSVPEYKESNVPKYSDSGKADLSLNVEQKSLDVPLKGDSRQASYGGDNNQKGYDEKNSASLNYQDNSAILEQKSIQSSSKAEYDVNTYTDSKSKSAVRDSQQKSVDVAFKSDDAQSEYKTIGGSGSEYPGIGSIDPTSNTESSVSKLEQKSVENGDYKEVKSNFKVSSKAVTGVFYSSNTDSDFKSSGLSDYNKDNGAKTYQTPSSEYQAKLSDGKNRGYPTASGGSSTSYFNAGHPPSRNTEDYNRRDNALKYPSFGNNVRSGYTSNNYIGSSGNLPRQTGNYFESGKTSSLGTTGNYPRHTFNTAIHQPYGGPSSTNYHRPSSHAPQSYFGNSGPKPLISGINNRFSHQQPSYNRGSRTPVYSGFQGISPVTSIPKYHESVSSGISAPRYSDSPDIYNNGKFVKISREYPQQSLKSNENSYPSSPKQTTDLRKPNTGSTVYYQPQSYQPTAPRYPSSISDTLSSSLVNSYPSGTSGIYSKRLNSGSTNTGSDYKSESSGSSDVHGGVDYSNGIGGIEYPGIGESSASSVASRSKPAYPSPEDTKRLVTEQKSYSNDEDTVSGIKSETSYPSGDEYKGIGEIGSKPVTKSQIVGGRHPVRKAIKTTSLKTKSSPSGVKGKSEIKTEQKYLPITAVLSNTKSETSDSKPSKKQYDVPTKTATQSPEKIEQQDLVYEAFLGGEGPQNHARGSSGYGFTRPSSLGSGSGGDPYKDEHSPPMPYEFEYDIKDDEHGSEQYRKEKMDNSGFLTGSYGFRDAEGIFREVEYEASKEGFKVNSIKTNEPGTDNENPADVIFEVQKHS